MEKKTKIIIGGLFFIFSFALFYIILNFIYITLLHRPLFEDYIEYLVTIGAFSIGGLIAMIIRLVKLKPE